MNLRTITFYAVYNPTIKSIITQRRFKKNIGRIPNGCVVVQMRGNYIPPRIGRTHWRSKP